MSQCCGKIPTEDDVDAIEKSMKEYEKDLAEKDVQSGGSGRTFITKTGQTITTSPHDPNGVGQAEKYPNRWGGVHYTTFNAKTGDRVSYDTDSCGNYVPGTFHVVHRDGTKEQIDIA